MDCNDDVFKWLEHALSLKTERGLRNSISRLRDAIIDTEIEWRNQDKAVMTHQKANLAFTMHLWDMSLPLKSIDING